MSTDALLFNLSAFIAGLFLLERGADLFVDNTATLAMRLGVSEVLIALLTAGAEWEELFVVIASLVQHRPALALGNVVGSAISNILGAFSIGLLFQTGVTRFDRSSRLYTAILFAVASVVSVISLCGGLGQVTGGFLVAAFATYVALVGWSIYRGVLAGPEGSGSESDSSSEESSGARNEEFFASVDGTPVAAEESSPLLSLPTRPRPILFPLIKLLLGFIALSLSGFILSHSSGTLASYLGLSESVFGATLLSLATTLPEKFVAVLSGSRGHSGILVANTVGSNIFLLTLCLGVTLLGPDPAGRVNIRNHELGWMLGSSLVLVAVVLFGSRRIVGGALLAAYAIFLALEFTIYRR